MPHLLQNFCLQRVPCHCALQVEDKGIPKPAGIMRTTRFRKLGADWLKLWPRGDGCRTCAPAVRRRPGCTPAARSSPSGRCSCWGSEAVCWALGSDRRSCCCPLGTSGCSDWGLHVGSLKAAHNKTHCKKYFTAPSIISPFFLFRISLQKSYKFKGLNFCGFMRFLIWHFCIFFKHTLT